MSTTLKSLLNTARQKISGSSTPVTPSGGLFPKVDPAIDGDDCDRDCESCTISYPRGFKIDEGDELYGHVKGWSQHVLVATGKSDWVRDVANEKGSVMEAIDNATVKPSQGVSTTSEKSGRFTDKIYRDSCSRRQISLLRRTLRTTRSQQRSSSYRHSSLLGTLSPNP